MSAVELALEKVKELSENQAKALLEWLRMQALSQEPASGQDCPLTKEPPWMKAFGAFGRTPEMLAETRRIQQLIDEEFERLEPEDCR